MKEEHQIWMDAFLRNCIESNKSSHTVVNYRCDLKKFIEWFERGHGHLLHEANAQTITAYKAYLSNEEASLSKSLSSPTLQRVENRRLLVRIKSFFKNLFTKKEVSPPAIIVETKHPLLQQKGVASFTAALAVTSRRRHLSAIKNFYEFLKQSHEDEGLLFLINPVKPKLHAIKLKDEDVQNTKLLTKEDWKAIKETPLKPKEKLIVHLLYYGGFRLSELSDLTVKAFDREKKSVTFVRKGGYVHELYLREADLLFKLLDFFLMVRRESSPYLFTGKTGKAITSRAMYDIIMKVIKEAACPTIGLSPHSFRKACATTLYEETKDLLYVRDYLNHADAKVTQTYIDRSGGRAERSIKF